jgi:HAD superfamily hydrolase (TIGR01549 family)
MDLQKNITVIVFDFDGTLHNLKVDWEEARKIVDAKPGEKLGEAVERVKKENPQQLKALSDLEGAALTEETLDPVVRKTLLELHEHYKVAVLSRNSSAVIKNFLKQNAVLPDCIVGREDTEHLKPHPEGLEVIAQHFGVQSHQMLMVGDTWHDYMIAANAGCQCVIVGTKYESDEQPVFRIGTIAELPGLLAAD